ncbi:hypothetical protein BIW11_06318, partial [Tropilaelaps mercedesae]
MYTNKVYIISVESCTTYSTFGLSATEYYIFSRLASTAVLSRCAGGDQIYIASAVYRLLQSPLFRLHLERPSSAFGYRHFPSALCIGSCFLLLANIIQSTTAVTIC